MREPETGARAGAPLTTPGRAYLVAEILVTYGRVRWQLARQDLPTVVHGLRRSRRPVLGRPPLDHDDRRLAAVTERVLHRLPSDARCLTRSLVVLTMLARQIGRASCRERV